MTTAQRLRDRPPRSWLFVPALRAPDWLSKAAAAGAEAIVVDLEDATAPARRQRAREVVAGLDITPKDVPVVFVRVNATPAELNPDIEAAVASGAQGVVVPKVDGPDHIRRVAELLTRAEGGRDQLAVVALIESPRAVLGALDIADAHPRVAGLALGAGDLSARVGFIRSRIGDELEVSRGLVVLAAAAAGVGAFDTPFLDLSDTAGLRDESIKVAQLGFSGKLVIHPGHVAIVNESFAPSAEQVKAASDLLDAFERALAEGVGASRHGRRMIDSPDAAQARRVLARAGISRPARTTQETAL